MCGIVGVLHLEHEKIVDENHLRNMLNKIQYRGPDDSAVYVKNNFGVAYNRLAIIDLNTGQKPFFNDDKTITVVCNGEIFNYKQLKERLIKKGYKFKTNSDIEVIIPLYVEYGNSFFNQINGQFALAIYDENKRKLILARDHFGICPIYYTLSNRTLFFASEIKALLAHPMVPKKLNLMGLDQVFTFPGVVSPTTLFKDINSIKPGFYIEASSYSSKLQITQYWDFNFPKNSNVNPIRNEASYIEELNEIFTRSVTLRSQADVPVGLYLSGGLDSSLVLAKMREIVGESKRIISLSADFDSKFESEKIYQDEVSSYFNTQHDTCLLSADEIANRLESIVYHAESPLRETFNTATLALSDLASKKEMKVMLAGQGADELFAGYVGYLFDLIRDQSGSDADVQERCIRDKLWGDEGFVYEKQYAQFERIRRKLYSNRVDGSFDYINCINHSVINKRFIREKSLVAKRSYIDLKLRLADHLLSDHGDRMALANSVEVRYPFLDIDLVNFAINLPDRLKLAGNKRKYLLCKYAEQYLPKKITNREKQGFAAPGSPALLQGNYEYVNDMLSYERIKSQGYFDADEIERLKKQYSSPGYRIKVPFESDLLITALTFSIFLELFELPSL